MAAALADRASASRSRAIDTSPIAAALRSARIAKCVVEVPLAADGAGVPARLTAP
jgi:hypothetical protein